MSKYLQTKKIDRSAHEPVYEQVAMAIQDSIEKGHLTAGDRLPTTRELCEVFGVNHLTIRQAVKYLEANGHVIIRPGRGAFVPTEEDIVRKVLLMLPSLGDEQCGAISRGVRSVLENKGFDIYVLDYNGDSRSEKAYLEKIHEEGYMGAILYPTLAEESSRLILRLLVDGFPIVLLDREFSGIAGWYALSDNYQGGYLAGQHLLECGCKEVACIINDLPNVQERLRGFQAAFTDAGIPLKSSRILTVTGAEGDPAGRCTEQLLKQDKKIDGIFYYNDYQALYGYKQIKAAGKRIPEDIKVVGFDDMFAARLADPELTTIHQHPDRLGKEAAEMFLAQLALPSGKRFQKKESIMPVELIQRESTR